jgi:hypothetical protein
MDMSDIEMEMSKNDELLILYRKDSGMCSLITDLINKHWISEKIVNRKIILDSLGEYNMVYSDQLDIEKVTDLLTQECMGYSVREMKEKIEEK